MKNTFTFYTLKALQTVAFFVIFIFGNIRNKEKYYEKVFSILLLCFLIVLAHNNSFAQTGQCLTSDYCATGGSQNPSGIMTPATTSWQTASGINAGEWQLFNVINGNIYEFSLCTADGGSCTYDGQLTLMNNSDLIPLCFSDDYCGDDPKIKWTATFNGVVRTQINLYNCATNSTSTTLAYKRTGPECATINNGEITIGCGNWSTAAYSAGTIPFWSFVPNANTTYLFSLCPNSPAEDTYIRIYNSSYVLVAENDNNGMFCNGTEASLTLYFATSDASTYYISVAHNSCSALSNGGNLSFMRFYGNLSSKGAITPTTSWQNSNYINNDVPYWSFSATSGTVYGFSLCSNTTNDSYLRIYDANWTQVAFNDDNGPYCSSSFKASIDWTATATGTFYILASSAVCAYLDADGSLAYNYTLPCAAPTSSPAASHTETNQSTTNVRFTWTNPNDADGVNIYKASDGTSLQSGNTAGYYDYTTTANTQVGIKLKAYKGATTCENASFGAVAYAYSSQNTPTTITFSSVTATSITATANGTFPNQSAGSSGVYILNSTNSTNSGLMTFTTVWVNGSLTCTTPYSYYAKAYNGDGDVTAEIGPTAQSTSATIIWSDGFEGTDNWTKAGNFAIGAPGTGNVVTTTYSGAKILGTVLNGNYASNCTEAANNAISSAINCTGYTSVTLKYWSYSIFQTTVDYGRVYVSSDNGSTWGTYVEQVGPTETAWTLHTLNISSADNKSQVKIKFTMVSNNSTNKTGWNIDDISVTGCPCAPSGGTVSGTSPVCDGSSGITYTYSGGTAAADAWSWTVPSNASITGGSGTATITVNWGTATSGNVTCTPSASGCSGTAVSKAVTVYDELTANISGGTSPICSGTSPGTFTATASGGTGSYAYLWYKDSISTGITTQTYDPGNLTASSEFYCAVTSGQCGTVNTPTSNITVNLSVYFVAGMGLNCNIGDNGTSLKLSNSDYGVTYQLLLNGSPYSLPVSGKGGPVYFDVLTEIGTYTVIATKGTATANMNGSVTKYY